jgi:hypothetical protein
MHARVIRFKAEPARIDDGIRSIKENVVPMVKKLAGFKSGYWLIDRKTGVGFSVVLFESEAAVQEASKKLREREQSAPAGGAQITGVEVYEVVAQA